MPLNEWKAAMLDETGLCSVSIPGYKLFYGAYLTLKLYIFFKVAL